MIIRNRTFDDDYNMQEMERVVIKLIDIFEEDLVREKVGEIFKDLESQDRHRKILDDVAKDISLCRRLKRFVVDYCDGNLE